MFVSNEREKAICSQGVPRTFVGDCRCSYDPKKTLTSSTTGTKVKFSDIAKP